MTDRSKMQIALLERMSEPQKLEDGTFAANITFDRDFPGFDGHFPGNPIVPAICQLSLVELLAQHALQNNALRTCRIASMKCRTPLTANDKVKILFSITQNDCKNININAVFHTFDKHNASKIKLVLN